MGTAGMYTVSGCIRSCTDMHPQVSKCSAGNAFHFFYECKDCMFLSVHRLKLSANYILQAVVPLLCISAVGWLVYLVGLSLIQSR